MNLVVLCVARPDALPSDPELASWVRQIGFRQRINGSGQLLVVVRHSLQSRKKDREVMMSLEQGRPATFFLSVDVLECHESSTLVDRIHQALRSHHIKALWSFEFVRHPEAVATITSSASEFGLLGNAEWSSGSCERSSWVQELATRTARANELGIKPIALAMTDSEAPPHFDLLVKHQIAILRTRTDKIAAGGQSFQPRLARYGIWEAEPTLLVPTTSRWSLPWSARRTIQRAIQQQQTVHVAINVAALSQSPASGLSTLERILKTVAARRDSGTLRVVSAREMLDLYSPRREQLHSRSVLRAA